MSRDINWLDRDYQESEDVSQIIEDSPMLVDVYRDQSGKDIGFDDVFDDQMMIKSIVARIDKLKQGFNSNPNESGKLNNHLFIGTTKEKDIKEGDIWQTEFSKYKVTGFDLEGQPYSEVRLEIQL